MAARLERAGLPPPFSTAAAALLHDDHDDHNEHNQYYLYICMTRAE